MSFRASLCLVLLSGTITYMSNGVLAVSKDYTCIRSHIHRGHSHIHEQDARLFNGHLACSQPPLLSRMVDLVYGATQDRDFLQEAFEVGSILLLCQASPHSMRNPWRLCKHMLLQHHGLQDAWCRRLNLIESMTAPLCMQSRQLLQRKMLLEICVPACGLAVHFACLRPISCAEACQGNISLR